MRLDSFGGSTPRRSDAVAKRETRGRAVARGSPREALENLITFGDLDTGNAVIAPGSASGLFPVTVSAANQGHIRIHF